MKLTAAGDAGLPGIQCASSEREDQEREAERWARAIAMSPELFQTLSPSAWREGVEGLTPRTGGRADGAAGAAGTHGGSARENSGSVVVLEVDAGDWGRISLSVSRVEGGLRVLLGARDATGAEGLLAERAALAGALARIGLRVESVQVVRSDQAGAATPAPSASVERARPRGDAPPEAARQGRPAARKLKVIG